MQTHLTNVTGDWILMAVGIYKQWEGPDQPHVVENQTKTGVGILAPPGDLFENLHWFVLASIGVSFVTYYSMCGFLQYYFYIRQKDKVITCIHHSLSITSIPELYS